MAIKKKLSLLRFLPIIIITIIGGILRFWNLNHIPPSLNWDEVSHGYNAYSILLTGKDEWGMKLPLIFRAFGDYKLPLYIYLTAIPIQIFGLTPFAVRFISVLAGISAIPGIYLLANQIFEDKKIKFLKLNLEIGLIAAFLLTLSPWHFFISRPALEANLGLTLFIFGVWACLKAIKNPKHWLPASVLLSLTLHTYNSYRVLTPLFVIAFVAIFKSKIRFNKWLASGSAIFALGLGLVAFQMFEGSGVARYSKLSILSDSAVYQIGQERLQSKLPEPLPRLLHNRPVYFFKSFVGYYLGYFSPAFTYQVWGPQYQFAIPGKNLFTLPVYILFLIGLIITIKKHTSRLMILLALLFLSPIPAALTADPPQALRPTAMIPAVLLIASLGTIFLLETIDSKFRNKKVIPLLLKAYLFILIMFSFGRYLHSYFTAYSKTYSQSWQYGYQEAIQYLEENKSSYDRVFFSKRYGEPHIFYSFYTRLDPNKLQPSKSNIRFQKSDWFWTDKIETAYFINDWQIPLNKEAKFLPLESGGEISTANSLIITTDQSLPINTRILKRIRFQDGSLAFVIAKFI